MLETHDPTTPGTDPAPRRRSPRRWLLVAAAVAVVAIVGGLLAAVGGDDDETPVDAANTPTSVPAVPPPRDLLTVEADQPIEPGLYFVDPDGDPATPLRVTFQVAEKGWIGGWFGPLKPTDDGHVVLSITTVTNLVTDGCTDHTPAVPPVGPTVDDLAAGLAGLSPFEVTSAPRDVTMAGYSGTHLSLRVPDVPMSGTAGERRYAGCEGENLHSWISPLNSGVDPSQEPGGAFSGYTGVGHTEELWILDVEGTRLVIETNQSPDRSPEDLAELEAIVGSIRIEP